jgi:hypothetical protein
VRLLYYKLLLFDIKVSMNLDGLKYIEVPYNGKTYYRLVDASDNAVIINTPFLYAPFGIDIVKDTFSVKLEFNNLCNTLQKKFYNLLESIDEKNIKFLGCKKKNYKKTVKKSKNYKDITVKLKTYKKRPICKVEFENNKINYLKTIYEVGKRVKISCDLELGLIWKIEKGDEFEYGMSLLSNLIIVK